MVKIVSGMGLKRMKGMVDEDNTPMTNYLVKDPQHKIFERVLERHIFFKVSRKTLEVYDPPITIAALLEGK